MESKYSFLCPLCSFETEQINVMRQYGHTKLKKQWVVCLDCRHLQEKAHPYKVFFQACRLIGLHVKHFLTRGHASKTTFLPKLFHAPTCHRCHSRHLLEWDGQCPKCGSAFLKKMI
jgi:hypothetical protein